MLDTVFVVTVGRHMSEITHRRWVEFSDFYRSNFRGTHSYNIFDELVHRVLAGVFGNYQLGGAGG